MLIVGGILALFVGAILAVYFAPHPDLLFGSNKPTDPNRMRAVEIEASSFLVPEVYLEDVDRPLFGSVRRLTIRIPWPYSPGAVLDEPEAADLTRMVVVDIARRPDVTSLRDRLQRIYPVYFNGAGTKLANGLTVHRFKARTPYEDSILYVSDDEDPVLFTCTIEAGPTVPPICERRLDLNLALTATYRFHSSRLAEWRTLDKTLTGLIRGYRQDGSK
ncbi:hypothetical protein FHS85_003419 [Rhodoligotrophos appendicifer]|uniref:hypothetical protein n=1 Tax=Rhodoligotrophos appendicifer TaxID=987056 RepID=UPI00118523C9|nr:hypothetical protein [Rhodoligotrophos appendicifer]